MPGNACAVGRSYVVQSLSRLGPIPPISLSESQKILTEVLKKVALVLDRRLRRPPAAICRGFYNTCIAPCEQAEMRATTRARIT